VTAYKSGSHHTWTDAELERLTVVSQRQPRLFEHEAEAREHGGPVFARSTISAVALNGLTTIAGFGSLLVAHHRGIRSLGLLLTVGSLTSLVAALVVLPVLVGLFDRAAGIDRVGDPARDSSV